MKFFVCGGTPQTKNEHNNITNSFKSVAIGVGGGSHEGRAVKDCLIFPVLSVDNSES